MSETAERQAIRLDPREVSLSDHLRIEQDIVGAIRHLDAVVLLKHADAIA